ncbi:MAG: hypothetical protein J6P69_04755 [Bacteroidales bacterium]|nr:hypothetical protein [Bacteroidales bacterium]
MDAVITYVNGNDPVWREAYRSRLGDGINGKHFRDWGTLKYLLRGIETHLPFIRNVFLVVSGGTQVPEWADRENLKIVLHSDIIPGEFLPVFNSTAIEMFLHRIPGLEEEFLYFNDDIFPLRDCRPEDFFREGRAAVSFHRHVFVTGMYKRHCRNCDRLAREAAGLGPSALFRRPQHSCTPLLRSVCEEISSKEAERIAASVSPVRRDYNFNYYLFSDYAFYTGRTFENRVSNKHFSTAVASPDRVCSFIGSPTADFACINDVNMSDERFLVFRDRLLEAFGKAFPSKSRFEL